MGWEDRFSTNEPEVSSDSSGWEKRFLADPNRDPIPGSAYDLSILQKPYMETLLPGSSMREGPAENAMKRLVDYNIGMMGKAAYWFDRPYTSVMSMIDAATQGKKMGEILSQGWKGFTGNREAGAINVLENAGGDPSSLANQIAGIGLDVVAGTFLDPVNYLTFGTKGPLRGVSAGAKLFGNADNAARFAEKFPRTFKALKAAGIEKVPGRVEAAQAGLWGVNVSLPYFGKEGVTVTPVWANTMAAKGMDSVGNSLQPLHDFVHKFWGGNRYWVEKAGAEDLYEIFGDVQQRQMQRTVRHMEEMTKLNEAVPVEMRRLIHHSIENPELVNAQGLVKTTTVRPLTPEEIAAKNADDMALNLADAKTVEEFNRGTLAEIAGLRNSLDDWTESAKRLRVVPLSDIEAYMFDVSDPRYHSGDALEELVNNLNLDPRRVESAITAMMRDRYGLPEDANVIFKAIVGEKAFQRMSSQQVVTKQGAIRPRTPQEIAGAMKREMGEWVPEQAADLGETGNARILVEVPAFSTLSDEFANLGGAAGLASMDLRKERVSKVLDALETNAKQGGNNLDLVENYMRSIDDTLSEAEQKAARKKYLAEVNRMNRRMGIVEKSDLWEVFDPKTGRKIETFDTQQEALEYTWKHRDEFLDYDRVGSEIEPPKFEKIARPSDSAMEEIISMDKDGNLYSSWVRLSPEQRLKKRTSLTPEERAINAKTPPARIDPNSPTFTQIVEAIHARRVANSHVPGYYTANARRLSEDLVLGEIFSENPAARYAHQQEVLRKELDVVNGKLRAADEGHIPAAEYVPPDDLLDVDLDAMRGRLSQWDELVAHRNKIDEQIRTINEREAEDAALHGDYDPEQWKGVREQLNHERWAVQSQLWDFEDAPIMEAQRRYKEGLLEHRDELIAQLKNPDPFDRAVYMRDMLKKRTRPRRRTPGLVADTRMVQGGGIDLTGLSPELSEHFVRGREMAEEVVDRYTERFRKYDPKFEMPIENYLPHIHAKHETALDKFLTTRRVKQYRNARKTEMQLQSPNLTNRQIEQMLEEEIWQKFGVREVRMSKAEREGVIGQFQRRKYSSVQNRIEHATVLAMQRSNFPIQWEDDFYRTMNSMFANEQKWEMAWDFTEELVRRGHARQLPAGMTQSQVAQAFGWKNPVRLEADHLGGLLTPDKNPFFNLWVDKPVRHLYDRFVTGHVQAVTGNEAMKKFLDVMNGIRRFGSAWTLLPFPSYHFRNMVGDTLRATHEGMDINLLNPEAFSNFSLATSISGLADPSDITRALPPPVRQGMKPTQLQDKLAELRGMYPQHANLLEEDAFWRYLRGNVFEENYRDLDNIQRKARGLGEEFPWKKGLNWLNPNPSDNSLLNWAGRKVGNRVQNQTRAWLFFDRLNFYTKSGMLDLPDAMKEAAKHVRKSLFDYTDLLPIEQHVWKNINWFYTYMSRSIPYHIERMISDPRTFSKYYRAYMGAWNNWENEFEPEDTRDFLSEQMGIPVRSYEVVDEETGRKEPRWSMWSPQGWIGAADVNEAAGWLRAVATADQNKLLQATSMNTNPVVKAALEQLFAVDMFTGQEIDGNEYSDIFGIPAPYRVNRLLRNVRLVNEFDRLNPGGIWTIVARDVFQSVEKERAHRHESPEMERWVQYVTGMRLFESNPVRDVERNLRDMVGKLDDHESTARSAQAQGNKLEFNKNYEAAMGLLPEIQATQERLRYWTNVESEEKQKEAIRKANQ